MDYCTLGEVRTELVKQGTSVIDDNAIVERIPRATALIDQHCKYLLPNGMRAFDDEVVTDELRYGEAVLVNSANDLCLTVSKGACQSVQSVQYSLDMQAWKPVPGVSIVDGYSITVVGAMLPRFGRLFVKVSYRGGYQRLPDAIVYAAARWTAFLYHKREAPFETIMFPDTGQVSIPSNVPSDITDSLQMFIRRRP